MIISKTSKDIIIKTFLEINKKYKYNLFMNKFKDITYDKSIIRYKLNLFTLDKNKQGSRININNCINKFACIHVHNDFIILLLNNNKNGVIQLCDDWIIKKDFNGNIIGNNLKNYSNSMHIINASSFLCNCLKNKGI